MSVQKYFVAIVLPSPVLEEAEAIKHMLLSEHGLKGALRSPAHITLHRPFTWKEEKEDRLIGGLNSFSYKKHFTIYLDGFSKFEQRVIYIHVAQNEHLDLLHAQLVSHCKKNLLLFNEADDLRAFKPHVTIASRDLKKNKFDVVWQLFNERPFRAEFVCGQIHLLKLSAKWEVIHTIKLQ
jgi:2'-5' RNA ligase